MTLRHKFGLLAVMYAATLAANVALCSWSLLLYYQSFLLRTTSEPFGATIAGSPDELSVTSADSLPGPSYDVLAAQILAINAVCGLGLGLLGLRLVRRWVMRPLADLRAAAVELGRGNLLRRADVSSRDELGDLAAEFNTMAASIAGMQEQLLEQERRQVAAQALRCIVHNVRSPLTGIRWLAEAVTMRGDVDPEIAHHQGRIMDAVDGVLSWLQEFRTSLEQACRSISTPIDRTETHEEA